jgi:hypothetical protein
MTSYRQGGSVIAVIASLKSIAPLLFGANCLNESHLADPDHADQILASLDLTEARC